MLNRRRVIKLLSAGGLAMAGAPVAASAFPRYRWILLYWMPYDNDLSRYAQEILTVLAEGVVSDQVLVLVQADTTDQRTMTRYVISRQGGQTQALTDTNSASPTVFADFLHWAASQYVAHQWMLSVVGHGGRLMQLSPDDGEGTERQWLDIRAMRDAIATFNHQTGQPLDLFFFQNCNKATLAACQTLAPVARYTLASQDLLGAPNRYYLPLLRWLGRTGMVTGRRLAHRIRAYETDDMYLSYSVIDNQRLRTGLVSALNP
ncbi:MAG: clostripain-related cysteine peptidase, partial [Cyanobacteria bacterium J06632_22]